jgi:hypothetical protein
MKDKALIKKTGEILNVESEYQIFKMKMRIKFNQSSDHSKEFTPTVNKRKLRKLNDPGKYYVLSNHESYP